MSQVEAGPPPSASHDAGGGTNNGETDAGNSIGVREQLEFSWRNRLLGVAAPHAESKEVGCGETRPSRSTRPPRGSRTASAKVRCTASRSSNNRPPSPKLGPLRRSPIRPKSHSGRCRPGRRQTRPGHTWPERPRHKRRGDFVRTTYVVPGRSERAGILQSFASSPIESIRNRGGICAPHDAMREPTHRALAFPPLAVNITASVTSATTSGVRFITKLRLISVKTVKPSAQRRKASAARTGGRGGVFASGCSGSSRRAGYTHNSWLSHGFRRVKLRVLVDDTAYNGLSIGSLCDVWHECTAFLCGVSTWFLNLPLRTDSDP